jgi:hypothetical protein
MGSHQIVFASSKRLDLPDERGLLWRVMDGSDGGLKTISKTQKVSSSIDASKKRRRGLTLNFGESASSGTGTRISTLLAVLRRLN